ncbi:MAG: hypothetical protein SFV54_25005 [Bryobacteraceae bacterium]|nr:hypothetical protein [Bryobacteraceae bacterium]
MLDGFSSVIIEGETNYLRFERFCHALCERIENRDFVPTSQSWDLGRDARPAGGRHAGSHAAVICATLNREVDEKVRNDLRRVAATSSPDRLIYCCSQQLSERHADRIAGDIRQLLPKASAVVHGSNQLAALAEKHRDLLAKYYQAEISTIETNLLAFREGHEPAETKGLRLALMTFGSDDARSLRKAISSRAVIEVLARLGTATAAEVAHKLSDDLRLPKALNSFYVAEVLAEVERSGYALQSAGSWKLTSQGETESQRISPDAAQELLQGRSIIRSALHTSLGFSLPDSQFDAIWSSLLDTLSELFYSNGVAVISAINSFLDQGGSGAEETSLEHLIEQGSARIRATTATPQLGEDIAQAINDMFTERSGQAFDWLARVCERFVALCALGLETTSADEVRRLLRRHQLVLDTDIVLSLLCEAEPAHHAIRDVVAGFRQLGGTLLVSPSVLEEVAYHAHISDREYQQTKHLIGKLSGLDLRRYLNNAFVRAFHHITKNPKHWALYLRQFLGNSKRDYTKVLHILQSELAVQMLPTTHREEFARQVATFIRELSKADRPELYEHDIGREGRDGRIMACIAAAREQKRAGGSDVSIVLLSSSGRLRRADHRFRKELGAPEAVLSFKGLSYLLSLVPNVAFGAGTLRQALFDFGETAALTDVERFALRVIKGSEQFSIPWVKRRALQDELDKVMRREAEMRGVPVDKVKQQFVAGDENIQPVKVIAEALRNVAIRDQQTQELIAARRKIRCLEGELEAFREARSFDTSTNQNTE